MKHNIRDTRELSDNVIPSTDDQLCKIGSNPTLMEYKGSSFISLNRIYEISNGQFEFRFYQ